MRKITSLLTLLLIAVGVSAQSYMIDVSASTGTFWRKDGSAASSSQWASKFVSNIDGAPVVTVVTTAGHKFTPERNGFSSEPNGTVLWTISVEDGYVITGWVLEGVTNNNTATVTPAGGTASTFNVSSGSVSVDGLATQSTTFEMTSSYENRINFSTYRIKVAKAYEVTVSQTTGSFTEGNANNTWFRTWESTATEPQVTVSASANNMQTNGSENIDYRSGQAKSSTYTVGCSEGFIIVSGSFTGAALTNDQTVSVEGNSKVFTTTEETFNFPVDSRARSFGFVLSGENSGLAGTMKVVMIKPSSVNVTYNLYWNGSLQNSTTASADIGYAPELPSSLDNGWMTYSYDVAEITSSTTEVNATATWAGPFEFGATLAESHWYFLDLKGTNYPVYVAGATENVQSPTTASYEEAAMWAFVGDPYTGFTIYNKAAGDGLVLGSANVVPEDETGGNQHVSMQAPGSQTQEVWTVKPSNKRTNGFFLLNAQGYALNQRSTNYLAYWTGGMDIGSTFVVSDAENFYSQVMSEIKPFYDAADDTYFNLSAAGAVQMATMMADVESTNTCSQADYNTLKSQLAANIVYPESGYFRIKSSGARSRESYIGYAEFTMWSNTYKGLCTRDASVKQTDVSTVIYFNKQSDGVYKLSLQGKNVRNQTTNNQCFPVSDSEGVDFTFRIYEPGVVAITNDFTDQGHFHEGNFGPSDGGAVVRWTYGGAASHWTVEDADYVTLTLNTVNGKSYATTYLPFDVTLNDDVKAYALTVTGDIAQATEIGQYVPAGTPVLLYSESGVTSVQADVTTSLPAYLDANDLQGIYLSAAVSNALVLNAVDNKPGFYAFTGSAMPANRAYLNGSSSVSRLVFEDGEVTSISALELNGAANVVYDLQGRRVHTPQHGVYVIGGRKVVVK